MKQDNKLREEIEEIIDKQLWKEFDYGEYPDIEGVVGKILSKVKEEIERELPKKAEKASVLNGKLRVTDDKDSTLYNEYSTKLAYNQALKQVQEILDRIL